MRQYALAQGVPDADSEAEIARTLSAPEQTETVRPGRVVYQSRVEIEESA
jgi:hypothetical protein